MGLRLANMSWPQGAKEFTAAIKDQNEWHCQVALEDINVVIRIDIHFTDRSQPTWSFPDGNWAQLSTELMVSFRRSNTCDANSCCQCEVR